AAANVFVYLVVSVAVLFFFSSRRRHTRSDRDWSSDVCSSDLPSLNASRPDSNDSLHRRTVHPSKPSLQLTEFPGTPGILTKSTRSEERRVGKESRSRRSGDH